MAQSVICVIKYIKLSVKQKPTRCTTSQLYFDNKYIKMHGPQIVKFINILLKRVPCAHQQNIHGCKKNLSLEFAYLIGLIIHLSYQLFMIFDILLSKIPLLAMQPDQRNYYSIFSPKLRWREELLKSKWPHSNKEMVVRKIFSVKNVNLLNYYTNHCTYIKFTH